MTLTLTPEIEDALCEAARQLGMTPEQVALTILHEKYVAQQDTQEEQSASIHALRGSMAHLGQSGLLNDRTEDRAREERLGRVRAARGSLAHISGSSDEFAAAKAQEKMQEERF